jgi:hypothetical protein
MKTGKLKAIEFVLENCESVQVDKEYIEQLQIGKTSFTYLWQSHLEEVSPDYFTDYCRIQFNYKLSNDNFYYPHEEHKICASKSAYDRLLIGFDVTSIILHFEDNTKLQIYIPWEGVEFTNKCQKISNERMLIISWEHFKLSNWIFNLKNKIDNYLLQRKRKYYLRKIK